MTVNLYIPTLNGGTRFIDLLDALASQSLQPQRCVAIDSGSTDGTPERAQAAGFEVIRIAKGAFDHGGTRQQAIDAWPDADIYVLLTQDAVPADAEALARITAAFADPEIGVAYGRQLPHRGAALQETHARLFNYPARSAIRGMEDAGRYGIRTISCSNSFAAYRRKALQSVGGFPLGTIMGEDVITAGKLLLNGWKLAYVSEACVNHSHNYRIREEFERYFDIGVFHSDNRWIFESFGRADGEGARYAWSELRYVGRRNPLLLPRVCCSFAAKWLGYKLGLAYRKLPGNLRKSFSMYKGYWGKRQIASP
ncbi:rhamnosyltransferase [Parapedobacter composti]|uniref:Rhamnosyltransferase n=1 Tax=Parapedobacter composti TaxID=623281 RepID=A0A1I1LRS3_9SPHI|nr:glycosyltransferase [Parapedobacter composti]SFC75729.1 rhamnosyltransferase [Parapedobacter composti]